MTRYCKDCRFFRNGVNTVTVQCLHPSNQTVEPVWGKVILASTPTELRSLGGHCGPTGSWFEACVDGEEKKQWPSMTTSS